VSRIDEQVLRTSWLLLLSSLLSGMKYGLSSWGVGADEVFYGSVIEWILQHRKGSRKSSNFDLLLAKDRDRDQQGTLRYIFVGDTGDRDEDAAERMIQSHGSSVLRAVFLHLVGDNPLGVSSSGPPPPDRVYLSVPIFYFRTYVSAGWKAYQSGLISRDALQCIINESLQDLEYDHKLSLHSPHSSSLCRCCTSPEATQHRLESRWEDVRSDISLIEQECPQSDSVLHQTLHSAELKLSSSSSLSFADSATSNRPAPATLVIEV
jgi:hypothetical protein